MENNTKNGNESGTDFRIQNYETGIPAIPPAKEENEERSEVRSDELLQVSSDFSIDGLAGAYIDGVHYYDFKNVHTINNVSLASLIDLLKCLLKSGKRVQFVNVNDRIKSKIKSLGLDGILNCS